MSFLRAAKAALFLGGHPKAPLERRAPQAKPRVRRPRCDAIAAPKNIDEILKTRWPMLDAKKRGQVQALADELKLPRWWVSKRARELGLVIAHKKEPKWSAPEEKLLEEVPLHNPDKCAEIFREHGFNRSPTAIVVRAHRRKISRRFKDALAAGDVAEILGVDTKTASVMLQNGEIVATRRKDKRTPQQGGHRWMVEPIDLRRYVLANLERIDLRKVEKFAFVQLIANEPLERPKQ